MRANTSFLFPSPPLTPLSFSLSWLLAAKIARHLDIDYAEAVVGFEVHRGRNCPTIDGIVVCEEFAGTISAAWEEA